MNPAYNFTILRTLATVTHGHILPSDAAARLRTIRAPDWMVLGLLTFDSTALKPEPEFGFVSRWFGQVAGAVIDCAGDAADKPQGNC